MHRAGLAALTTVLIIAAISLAGCEETVTQVTSPWPVANAERAVPEPPVPPRWPYTGKTASAEARTDRRPLSVKIENSPAARPQLGLNSADVVYETISEGGITRFNAILHSNLPETLGPVRSARLSDLWIVPQYDGLFFYSGASASVNQAVNNAGLPNLSQDRGIAYPYWRSTQRFAPHNLMLDTKKAYVEAKRRKYSVEADLKGLQFARRSAASTPTITRIDIPFSQANRVRWEYDPKSKNYLRWNNGAVHRDAASGKQINPRNVVVMWAKYRPASRDKVGSTTFDITLGGEGRVSVFRGGQRFDGTWTADRAAPPRFVNADGAPIKLAAGRTWFQVIPLDGTITME